MYLYLLNDQEYHKENYQSMNGNIIDFPIVDVMDAINHDWIGYVAIIEIDTLQEFREDIADNTKDNFWKAYHCRHSKYKNRLFSQSRTRDMMWFIIVGRVGFANIDLQTPILVTSIPFFLVFSKDMEQ